MPVGGARKRVQPRVESLVAALSQIAAHVQRGRTTDAVLAAAGEGTLALGMRLGAFQITDRAMVLRYIATAPSRQAAIERRIGRPLRGLETPLSGWALVREVIEGRRTIHFEDLDLFERFLQESAGFDSAELDARPDTARIKNGVLAPIFVRERPWGLLAVFSHAFTGDDADAVALFALQVGSALEVAEAIEALQRSNEEKARVQEELIKRERLAALGELAAMVAHEVRNPLGVLFNSIASLRKTLRCGALAQALPEAEMLLRIAGEEADRLNRIVSALLDFARPSAPHFEPSSVRDVIEDAVEAAEAGQRARIELARDLPLVEMDPRSIRRALLNVVINGLQAMPEDGALTVRATVERREGRAYARIDVADTGSGIPVDVRAAIFEPFFTTKASGTGLGLAVVKQVVESHGGDVSVESGAFGTTFTLRLPVSHES
jgi:signal transduction histidine kinase